MNQNVQDMQGKLIIVGGASSGIGRAVAEEYIARGATVVVLARRAEKLEEIEGAIPCAIDLREKPEVISAAIDSALTQRGISQPVNEIHNYAGVMSLRRPDEVDEAHMRHVMGVNVLTGWHLVKAVQNHMQVAPDAAIALCSSAIVEIGEMYGIETYVQSKKFLEAYIVRLREKLQAQYPEMTVTSVRPGLTRTEMATNGDAANQEVVAKMLMLFATEADECARAVVDDVQAGVEVSHPTWDAKMGSVVVGNMPEWMQRMVRKISSAMHERMLNPAEEVADEKPVPNSEPASNRPWRRAA